MDEGTSEVFNAFGGNDLVLAGEGNDVLFGGNGNDTLDGGNGHDALFGDASNDTLRAGNGEDQLYGGAGNDRLEGGAGNDLFIGGTGQDIFIGGSGTDHAYFAGDDAQVTIDLSNGTARVGADFIDVLSSIENATGSRFNDTVLGSSVANVLDGFSGMDLLEGGFGNDILFGGAEQDTLVGGAGRDQLYGGEGNDYASFVDQPLLSNGLRMFQDLMTGTAGVVGGAVQDVMASIEHLYGSRNGDDMLGNLAGNALNGLDGDDFISGLGGHDFLGGQGGSDLLVAGDGNDVLMGGAGRDQMFGNAGADAYLYFDGVVDSGVGAGNRDIIGGFAHGLDEIGLFFDARASQAGSQDFTFIGGSQFSAEGQVRVTVQSGNTIVQLNTSGTSNAEMEIQLNGLVTLTADDFQL